jgi:predicted nucleic acid-binding protein
MKIREARLAVLDTNVIADLASKNPVRQQVTTERLDALHKEGLLTAVTSAVLVEMVTTLETRTRKTLIDTVASRVDVYLPFGAGDVVRMELSERDPKTVMGDRTLMSARGLARVLDEVEEPDIAAYLQVRQAQDERVKRLAPQEDPKIRQLTKLPTFADHARRNELTTARGFGEFLCAQAGWDAVDIRPKAMRSLLRRGKAVRMGVLMSLAFHYRRAQEWFENKQTPKPAGALSDAPIVGAAAYAHVLLTADKEFIACGKLLNDLVAQPNIRRWELT